MGESRRVALLARPGEACERLRAALREAGGDIVLEGDPSTLDPQALRVAAVETVLVALDPAVEDALEKFDEVLGDRAVEVIFDEADLAARREGWDAARWVRHLAAKLHRHDDVLPPGREPDAGGAEASAAVTFEAVTFDVESLEVASLEVESAEPESIELETVEVAALDAVEFDMDTLTLDSVASFEPVEANFEPVAAAEPAATSNAFGGIAFTDDLDSLEFDAGEAPAVELATPTFGHDVQDFDALLRDLGAGASNDLAAEDDATRQMPPVREFAPAEELPSLGFDIAPLDAPTAKEVELAMPDFGALSLEAVDDQPAGMTATVKASDAPVAPKFKHDLSELERKISSLSLVGDAAEPAVAVAEAPAPAKSAAASMAAAADVRGAVVILAGIGGPDAVRQILTALPTGFPRAVLIGQRLDGGRYDRLVQQMARASALPVHLAEPAAQIAPGHVYIVPPELGVEAGAGLRFANGASLLDALAAEDTAVLLLSGADPALVAPALAHSLRGALVAGQSPDGCYDAAAPLALTAGGGTAGTPLELVQSLLQRWPA